MDISIAAILILFVLQEAVCDGYGNSSFDRSSGLIPSSDLIIYTNGGPVPDYLLNSPYKIVPLPNRSFNRRADDSSSNAEFSSKESRNSTIVEDFTRDVSLEYKPQISIRQRNKQRKLKNRNRSGGRNPERYNQRVESPDNVVAVPLGPEQNVQVTSTINERNGINSDQSKRPVYINNANKLTTIPPYVNRDKNMVNLDQIKAPVYGKDVNRITNAPSYLLPSENFATPLAYSPLSSVYSTNPSFVDRTIPTPPVKSNKFPRPALKGYDAIAYDFGPVYKPYSFGYDVFDGYGTKQYRQESATGDGAVRGNYGYKDFQGIYRQVEYTADENGFRAVLKSNEPGLANADTADVSVSVEPPPVWPLSEK